MISLEHGGSAVVIGAAGGIGAALVKALADDPAFETVIALARAFNDDEVTGKIRTGRIDITDEASVRAAAGRLTQPLRLVIVATGVLQTETVQPEKTYRALDAAAMLESYRINTIGPAMVAKHMLPLLAPRGRSVFAALSARVGSIGDNRTGGWHSYRASKAALNMIIRNLAIETARKAPDTLCIGLHPGTVDTALSRPFQRSVAPSRLFTADHSAGRLLAVIDGLSPEDNGRVLAWDASVVPP